MTTAEQQTETTFDIAQADDQAEADREQIDAERAELSKLRDLKNITANWRDKFRKAQAKTAKADAAYDEADAQRKKCKATREKCVAEERALMARFTAGEQLLPFDAPEGETPEQPGSPAPAVTGDDEGAAAPITVLLAKEIKKIVGKEVFAAAKDSENPIGLTEKAVDVLVAQGWDTIGQMEKAMRENAHWSDGLDGFGEKKRTQLIDTLLAFRRVHPQPEAGEPIDAEFQVENDNDWRQAEADLNYVVELAGDLINSGPEDSLVFAKSVGSEATEMRADVRKAEHVTDGQLEAIHNWTEGLEKWKTPAG